jgi:hypothetical protein
MKMADFSSDSKAFFAFWPIHFKWWENLTWIN